MSKINWGKYPRPDILQDTTQYLWDYRFRVTMNFMQSTNQGNFEKRMHYYSRDYDGIDLASRQQIVTEMSINNIYEQEKLGSRIHIVGKVNEAIVFSYINVHLRKWAGEIQKRGLNRGRYPLDDLIGLDQYASRLFGSAKFYLDDEQADSPRVSDLDAMLRTDLEMGDYTSRGLGRVRNHFTDTLGVNKERSSLIYKSYADLFHDVQGESSVNIGKLSINEIDREGRMRQAQAETTADELSMINDLFSSSKTWS